MPQNQSIDTVICYEIKREIAQRYFGFRKLIEDDELALSEKIRQYSYILEKRISFDLIRIYILLKDEGIIQDFLELIGLHKRLFYDSYLVESPEISRRVFKGQRFRGLFRSSRYKNFILDCYDNLTFHANTYQRKVKQLQEEQVTIAEEIKLFYRNNDLSVIMHFLHAMSDPQISGSLQGGMEIGLTEGLEKKLAITPPQPIEETMTILPPLKPLSAIKTSLKQLAKKAYKIQADETLALFDQKEIGDDRLSNENPNI